mgnify:CR=1 FL=1
MKKILTLILLFPTIIYSQNSYTISSGNFYYYPSSLTIEIGDTVHWINDGGFHNVNFITNSISGSNFNNPESFSSIPTSAYNIYSHVFTIPGNYEYDCSVGNHAINGMIGSIIVSDNTTNINSFSLKKEIISKFNILGKSNSSFDKIVIILYNDGTYKKLLNLDNLTF